MIEFSSLDFWEGSTYRDKKKAAPAAKTNGGAHNSKVTVGLNPIVALNVGKYALNDNAVT